MLAHCPLREINIAELADRTLNAADSPSCSMEGKSQTTPRPQSCSNIFQTMTSCMSTSASAIPGQVEERGTMPNIPPKSQMEELLLAVPLWQPQRHERTFSQLKDFRRVATRHDRNVVNFPAASLQS
jgi:hypothetical protein